MTRNRGKMIEKRQTLYFCQNIAFNFRLSSVLLLSVFSMFCTCPIYFLRVQTSSEIVPQTLKPGTFMRLYFFYIKVKLCYWVTIVQNNFLILRSSDCPTAIAICERCRLCFEVFPPTIPTNFPLCLTEISAFPFHDFRFRFPRIKEKTQKP